MLKPIQLKLGVTTSRVSSGWVKFSTRTNRMTSGWSSRIQHFWRLDPNGSIWVGLNMLVFFLPIFFLQGNGKRRRTKRRKSGEGQKATTKMTEEWRRAEGDNQNDKRVEKGKRQWRWRNERVEKGRRRQNSEEGKGRRWRSCGLRCENLRLEKEKTSDWDTETTYLFMLEKEKSVYEKEKYDYWLYIWGNSKN